MNYQQAILEQTIAVQRKSDALLGRNRMDYDQFCAAIDEVTHPDLVTDTGLNAREVNKAMGKLIHEQANKPYYDIFLSVKFNTVLK